MSWPRGSLFANLIASCQILDLIDQQLRADGEIDLREFINGPVVERGVVQGRLDLTGQLVAFLGDLADPFQIARIHLVIAGDGPVGPDQAGAAETEPVPVCLRNFLVDVVFPASTVLAPLVPP